MTRSAPADTGSWFGVAKRVSLDADVLDRILPFGFTLVCAKSVHLRQISSCFHFSDVSSRKQASGFT